MKIQNKFSFQIAGLLTSNVKRFQKSNNLLNDPVYDYPAASQFVIPLRSKKKLRNRQLTHDFASNTFRSLFRWLHS